MLQVIGGSSGLGQNIYQREKNLFGNKTDEYKCQGSNAQMRARHESYQKLRVFIYAKGKKAYRDQDNNQPFFQEGRLRVKGMKIVGRSKTDQNPK